MGENLANGVFGKKDRKADLYLNGAGLQMGEVQKDLGVGMHDFKLSTSNE